MAEERLQKFLARAGVASRRAAETLITAGRVSVNGKKVTQLGSKIDANSDHVTVDGKAITLRDERTYILLYKPEGVITTASDPQGRETVAHLLEDVEARVFPVGRLDYDAEGALLFTDDGEIANKLMHPRYQVPRTYLVKVKGAPTESALEKLVTGVRLEDGPAKAAEVQRFEAAEKNTWLRMVVTEGRNHLIKRLCAAVGHPVLRLYRPSQAGIGLGNLRPGRWRLLTREEIETLQLVSKGAPPPEVPLKLPPRRHGPQEQER